MFTLYSPTLKMAHHYNYYAEIDVLAKKQNKVPEPDSEETSHHVYAILEQLPSPQVA